MLTLFGNLESGNVHKVQMILARRGVAFRRVDVAQVRGEPRRPEFLALNPIGKVPVLLLDGGDVMTESGAILYHFAEGTGLWPEGRRAQSEVLRWMFFEQYSHEPALAVLRYLRNNSDDLKRHEEYLTGMRPRVHFALDAMQARLGGANWLAGDGPSIADYALYPYTRMADEAGIEIEEWPSLVPWLARVEAEPGFLPVYAEGAAETVSFEDYFGG
jgi:glutathione S-transferase